MKKWYSLLFVLLFTAAMLAGCGEEAPVEDNSGESTDAVETTEDSSFPVTLTDALGDEVVIESKPERIISLIPSNTEISFAIGLGEQIVGVSEHDNYPEEVFEKEVIGGMEMNVEKIISLSPDLVLAHASSAHNSAEGLEQLRNSGISVVVINDAANFEDVYKSIEMIGTVTGEVEAAEKLIQGMQEKISSIQEKATEVDEVKSVMVEVNPAPDLFVVGKNTFMDEMIKMINAENAAGDLDGWVNLDEESYIERNPEVIITTYGDYVDNPVDQVLARDGWQDVEAVKNEQVIDVNADMVTRSGPRLAEGIEELAKAIYPEVFSE